MTDFNVSFCNVNNLFDTIPTLIGSNTDFTPSRGWTDMVKNKKIENLSYVINSLHDNQGPDILGICEIESEKLACDLLEKLRKNKEYSLAHYIDGPDIRGIDTCLLYSTKLFRLNSVKSYNINLRYPTRDIFVVNLTLLSNDAELTVIVNHWPSRGGGRFETEPYRISAAENCARAVEDILKINLHELHNLSSDLRNDERTLTLLNQRWNKNILIMGDFNDNPYDRSILNYLHATPDKKKLMDWGEIFEHPTQKRWPANRQTDKHNYLFYQAYLFNCMWPLIPEGTIFYDGGYDLFDQFIVSKGLLNGEQNLKINLNEIKINKKIQMDLHLSEDNFDTKDRNKLHPSYKKSPMRFEYQRIKPNGDFEEISPGRKILTGYSDHFPIESKIDVL